MGYASYNGGADTKHLTIKMLEDGQVNGELQRCFSILPISKHHTQFCIRNKISVIPKLDGTPKFEYSKMDGRLLETARAVPKQHATMFLLYAAT